MSDIKVIDVDQLERKIQMFDNESLFFEKSNNNFKTSSINKTSNINIIRQANKLNNLYDNLSRKYEKGVRWFLEYINEVKSLENDLISGIEKPTKPVELSKLDINIPTSIAITTVIEYLGLIKTINKDGSVFYSGSKDGVYYTLHLPESEITGETSMLLSFNGGNEYGSKPGDFSKIHNVLGCQIIKDQPKDIQEKTIVLAIQIQDTDILKEGYVDQVANVIRNIQETTGVGKEKTGSLSHSIGGRFSLVLFSQNPDIVGWASVVSPSRNRNGEYDLEKIDNLLEQNSNINIVWGSSDNKLGQAFNQSPVGVANTLLKEVAGVDDPHKGGSVIDNNSITSPPSTFKEYIALEYPDNKLNVFNCNEEEQFIRINGMGHGIGEKVATASFEYFINEYLKQSPQSSASTSKGIGL